MSTPATVKAQLRLLLSNANETTQAEDTTLTEANETLIAGYGQSGGGSSGENNGSSGNIIDIKPIFDMPLSDSLDFTSEAEVTVSYSGEEVIFAEEAFSATTYSSVSIEFTDSLNECTVAFEFKINSTGLSKYPKYRRLLWAWDPTNECFDLEVGYSGSTSTNKLTFLATSFTETLNDGNWHKCVVRKNGKSIMCEIDGVYFYGGNVNNASAELRKFTLSHNTYSLNGFIKNFKIYDTIISNELLDADGASTGDNLSVSLQEKVITENGTYLPDTGYQGLSKVIVNVNNNMQPFEKVDSPSFEFNNGVFTRNDSKSFIIRSSGLLNFLNGNVELKASNLNEKIYNDGIFCGYYSDDVFTVEAYFKVSDINFAVGSTYSQYAISNFQSGGFTIGISSEANGLKAMGSFYDTGISGYVNVLYDKVIENEKYIHIIMALDSKNKICKCFFNGDKKEVSISGNYKAPTSNTQIAFCANPYGSEYVNQDFLKGSVKVARYYNRFLTDEECLQNYNYIVNALNV